MASHEEQLLVNELKADEMGRTCDLNRKVINANKVLTRNLKRHMNKWEKCIRFNLKGTVLIGPKKAEVVLLG